MDPKVSVMMRPVRKAEPEVDAEMGPVQLLDRKPEPEAPAPGAFATFQAALGGTAPEGRFPLLNQLTADQFERGRAEHPDAAGWGEAVKSMAFPMALGSMVSAAMPTRSAPPMPAARAPAAPAEPSLLEKANQLQRDYLNSEIKTRAAFPKTLISAATRAAEPPTVVAEGPEAPTLPNAPAGRLELPSMKAVTRVEARPAVASEDPRQKFAGLRALLGLP